MGHPLLARWPLFGLVVRTPRLELRYPDDELVVELAAVAAAGIHDPEEMPFGVPWTDTPAEELPRTMLQHTWGQRGSWSASSWAVNLAVVVDGRAVGAQGLRAEHFAVRRVVSTGSWLGRGVQRQGIGTEMRQAVLHLAFAGLGANAAESGAWEDNVASQRVSDKCGYEPNGDEWCVRRDQRTRQLRYLLTRERWATRRRDDIGIDGLEPCLELFGVDS